MFILNIRQGAQLTWQYFSMYRDRNEATGAERDEKLRESRIVWLTRSVSCSGVCPSVWPVWSSDPGRGTPWSPSSYEVRIVWGCWESDGGRPAVKSKDVAATSFSYVSFSWCVHCSYSFVINFWNPLKWTTLRERPSLPERTTAFLPKPLQQQKKEPCHKPKVKVITGASQERQWLALPFFTVTLHLQKGKHRGQKNATALSAADGD